MEPGIYILLLTGEAASVRIGSLGTISFEEGFHCYVGSALGPGGLTRVARHIRVASSGGKRPRWHIDYLLMNPGYRLTRVYCAITGERLECSLAHNIPLPVIPGFGSSDCQCKGHLFYSHEDPESVIRAGFETIGLQPVIRIL